APIAKQSEYVVRETAASGFSLFASRIIHDAAGGVPGRCNEGRGSGHAWCEFESTRETSVLFSTRRAALAIVPPILCERETPREFLRTSLRLRSYSIASASNLAMSEENPKHEFPTSKQIRMTNCPKTIRLTLGFFEHLDFHIDACFGLRYSDFEFVPFPQLDAIMLARRRAARPCVLA